MAIATWVEKRVHSASTAAAAIAADVAAAVDSIAIASKKEEEVAGATDEPDLIN